MEDSNINEIIQEKCERCQIDKASIICHSCQPFQKFCHRCDSIIHSLKIKSNHVRDSLIQNQLNDSKNQKIIKKWKYIDDHLHLKDKILEHLL